MATRMKTVQYAFPALASLTNNTLTNLSQITIFLPENAKVFRSVVAHISMDDIVTATGGSITTKTFALRLGAAAYTTLSNTATITNSGENLSLFWNSNFTSHFATNWTGTSMTCDFQLQINQSTGTTLGMVNVCVTLEITYEYDSASATKIKTILLPLSCPPGDIGTAATTLDTIPALTTLLPEASKVFRSIFVVTQGGVHGTGTVDHTMTLRVGAASVTTGNYEAALASNRFTRYVWNLTATYPNTAAAQNWQPTASVANVRLHQQAWLAVTYEYNEAATTRVFTSVQLGGNAARVPDSPNSTLPDFLEQVTIVEAGVTPVKLAYFIECAVLSTVTTLSAEYTRPDTGVPQTVNFTDNFAAPCGMNAFMVPVVGFDVSNPAIYAPGFSFSFRLELSESSAAQRIFDAAVTVFACYTADKEPLGSDAHPHTVRLNVLDFGTGATVPAERASAAIQYLDEAEYGSGGNQTPFWIDSGFVEVQLYPSAAPVPSTVKFNAGGSLAGNLYEVQAWSFAPFSEVGYFVLRADLGQELYEDDFMGPTIPLIHRLHRVYGASGANGTCFMGATIVFTVRHQTGTISGTIAGAAPGTTSIEAESFDARASKWQAIVAPDGLSYTLKTLFPEVDHFLVATKADGLGGSTRIGVQATTVRDLS